MRRFSKAQQLSARLFGGAMTLAFMLCILSPFVVSFGGAYSTTAEYFGLILYLCWIITSRVAIVACIPFVITTFIKGLF